MATRSVGQDDWVLQQGMRPADRMMLLCDMKCGKMALFVLELVGCVICIL